MSSSMKEVIPKQEPSSDEDIDMPPAKRARLVQDQDKGQDLDKTIDSMMHGLSFLGGSSIELKLENISCYLSKILESHKMDILRILGVCVVEHPGHVSAYATFVGLANVRSYRFGSDCVQFMVQKLRDYLLQGEWLNARVVLRFLVDLFNCNVITGSSLMRLLTAFVAECEDPGEPGDMADALPQERRDCLAFCVLSALPFVGKELEHKAGFQRLMVTLQIHVKKRIALHAPILRVWRGGEGPPQLDQLQSLWHQVKAMAEHQWPEPEHHLLPRPYLAFDERLSAALQHSLPTFEVPPHEQGLTYPQSQVIFRLFEFRLTAEELKLPPALSIERYLLEALILDVLQSHHLDRKKCTKHLLSIASAKPALAVGHCIVEVILGEMLRLPKAAWPTINYGSILIELCRLLPYRMPPIVAQAANILFSQLESMSVVCFDRLVNWLSLHLSNFGFHWHWGQWAQDFLAPNSYFHPKEIFLRELICKCIRLSYHRKISSLLPDSLARFLPAMPQPQFKYIDPLIPGATLSEQLLDAMRNKRCDADMVSTLLSGDSTIGELRKINVFTQNCLHLSSKSFSHTFATLAKYLKVFKEMASGETQQHAVLEAIFEVWMHNQHFTHVVIEKLIRMEVLEPKCVVSWLFGPLMRKELTKMYTWELLHVTVRLVQNPQRLGPRNRQLEKVEPQDSAVTDAAVRGILLDIVQRIIKVLSAEPEGSQGSDEHYQFQWILGRMQELLFTYEDEYQKLGSKLVKISGDADLQNSIAKTIQAFLAYVIGGNQQDWIVGVKAYGRRL